MGFPAILVLALIVITISTVLICGGLLHHRRQNRERQRQQRLLLARASTPQTQFRGETGLEESLRDALPVVAFGGAAFSGFDSSGCAVCLEKYAEGEKVRALPCAHVFHVPCLDTWLRTHATCPICRVSLGPPRKSEELSEDPCLESAPAAATPGQVAAADEAGLEVAAAAGALPPAQRECQLAAAGELGGVLGQQPGAGEVAGGSGERAVVVEIGDAGKGAALTGRS